MKMKDEEVEKQIRDEPTWCHMNNVAKGRRPFLFQNIDSFVMLSKDNTSVKFVELYPFDGFDGDAGNFEFGRKWVKWWKISWSSKGSVFVFFAVLMTTDPASRDTLSNIAVFMA
jgi:hypothetical protein